MIAADALASMAPGFQALALDAQRTFRRLMDAMARPGTIVDLDVPVTSPVPGFEAAGAIALALLDFETPVWLSADAEGQTLANWLRFHCGCPLTPDPAAAAFAIVRADALQTVEGFNRGDPKYPETSTTLLIVCPALTTGPPLRLDGPGIAAPVSIAPAGLTILFWESVIDDRSQFQLGIDLVLASGQQIVGLPRSTRISIPSSRGE